MEQYRPLRDNIIRMKEKWSVRLIVAVPGSGPDLGLGQILDLVRLAGSKERVRADRHGGCDVCLNNIAWMYDTQQALV